MKNYTIIILLISLIFLFSCEKENATSNQVNTNLNMEEPDESLLHDTMESDFYESNSEDTLPKVTLDDEDELIKLVNINLDLDSSSEQILAVKKKNDNSSIRIFVVDYDGIRQLYYPAWSFSTQATEKFALEVGIEDITGDFNLEIIISGMNPEHKITLDVFRKTIAPNGIGLFYKPICQVSSDISIKILRHKRPQSYQLNQAIDKCFPILVEKRDQSSDNILDTILQTYYWQHQNNLYVLVEEEKIPGDVIAQQQLEEIFSPDATSSDYEEFLKGTWYLESDPQIMFDYQPNENNQTFFNGGIIESHFINKILRFGYSLTLIAENMVNPNITKWIEVKIKELNKIEISVEDNIWDSQKEKTEWDGIYRRITDEIAQDFFKSIKPEIHSEEVELSGIFSNSNGEEISFDLPYFTWIKEDAKIISGGYTIISNIPLLNGFILQNELPERVHIISFRELQENGLPLNDTVYLLDYSEEKENNFIKRTILLIPAKLLINGVEITSPKILTFEQNMMLEEEENEL